MLYKAIGITLAALFIVTFNISVASAGCGGHGGYHTYQSKAPSRAALQQSRARKAALAQARAKAKQKKAIQQAKAASKPKSTEVAAVEPVQTKPETVTKVAAVEQTCTRFFAETGTTVTVECAQQ